MQKNLLLLRCVPSNSSSRLSRSMKSLVLCLLFALAAKAWEDTTYDRQDFQSIKGKSCLHINKHFLTNCLTQKVPTESVNATELN